MRSDRRVGAGEPHAIAMVSDMFMRLHAAVAMRQFDDEAKSPCWGHDTQATRQRHRAFTRVRKHSGASLARCGPAI
jgi:hypothetical protein